MKGGWRYLYRAIDGDRHTLDIQLLKTRDHKAAYMFYEATHSSFRRTNGPPNRQCLCTFKKLKHNGFHVHKKHCTVKHLNNLIEQDPRHIKRRFVKSAGFQSPRHASRTLKGKERNRNDSCYIQTKEKSHSRLLFFDVQEITAIIQSFLNDNDNW